MTGQALTQPAAPTTLLSECRMSMRLSTLLLDPSLRDEAMLEISRTPALLAEARTRLTDLERTLNGCSPQDLKDSLREAVLQYGVGEAARSMDFWAPYIRAFQNVPRGVLPAAVQAYMERADSLFFPKVGQLREIAMKLAAPNYQAVSRIRAALRAPAPKQIDRGTAEQRKAQVAEVLKSLRRSA